MLHGAFLLRESVPGIELPAAIAMVATHPAEAVGLYDRGKIVAGKRADLLRVALVDGVPVVRSVWRQGQRVM
jgi:alpha-D-ribose 1-methylphosphonate 5-triphosphate diphosphatase